MHLSDFGRREGLAVGHEQQRQDHDGEDEIGYRSAGDDRRPLAEPLAMKGHGPFRRAQLGQPRDRQTRSGVGVAKHLDVAAERDRAELPASAGPVPPAEQFRPKPDREYLDPDPIPARNPIVAKLVNKDEDGQHNEKNADVINPAVQKRCQKIHLLSAGSAKRALAPLPITCSAIARAALSKS